MQMICTCKGAVRHAIRLAPSITRSSTEAYFLTRAEVARTRGLLMDSSSDIFYWALWTLSSILVASVSVIAFRIAFKFDINRWIENRRKVREKQFKSLCPHVDIWTDHGKVCAKSLFVSPPGTLAWVCQRCGMQHYSKDHIEDMTRYWLEHPDEYIARLCKIEKLGRKLGYD